MSNKRTKLPLHERWPDRYSASIVMYAPSGTRIVFETDLPTDLAEEIVTKVAAHVAGGSRVEEQE